MYTDPVLQTDDLNQHQAMQKAEEVHQFRQHRTRVLSIRDIDQEEQLKVKDKILDMYGEMRVSLHIQTMGDTFPYNVKQTSQNHRGPGWKEVLKAFGSQLLRKG